MALFGLVKKGWKGLQCVIMTRISVHISRNIYNVWALYKTALQTLSESVAPSTTSGYTKLGFHLFEAGPARRANLWSIIFHVKSSRVLPSFRLSFPVCENCLPIKRGADLCDASCQLLERCQLMYLWIGKFRSDMFCIKLHGRWIQKCHGTRVWQISKSNFHVHFMLRNKTSPQIASSKILRKQICLPCKRD